MRRSPDHPHARGENCAIRGASRLEAGPSPRTWGELGRDLIRGHRTRTIPTHVGRTTSCCISGLISADHPHARGENQKLSTNDAANGGPSPRTWGEPRRGVARAGPLRTIATHVGRTGPTRTNRPGNSDHPHARGENDRQAQLDDVRAGPSPRTWGEQPRGSQRRS